MSIAVALRAIPLYIHTPPIDEIFEGALKVISEMVALSAV